MNTISMQGTRLPDTDDDSIVCSLKPGDYLKIQGQWHCVLPNGDFCDLHRWTVEEHEDGTITASQSINSIDRWHGHLVRGYFRSC